MIEVEERPRLLTALDLRELLLNQAELIDLSSLVSLCWSLNIPVAHLRAAPANAPHAMAINVDGRCSIVLIRNRKHQGWHLFDLAHELGHVMLGHVKPGEAIVDGEGLGLDQKEETEANRFAFELLTGTPEGVWCDNVVSGEKLLAMARDATPSFRVDPQWMIVCVGANWDPQFWGVTGRALKLGWPNDDAPGLIEDALMLQMRNREVSRTRQALIKTLAVREAQAA